MPTVLVVPPSYARRDGAFPLHAQQTAAALRDEGEDCEVLDLRRAARPLLALCRRLSAGTPSAVCLLAGPALIDGDPGALAGVSELAACARQCRRWSPAPVLVAGPAAAAGALREALPADRLCLGDVEAVLPSLIRGGRPETCEVPYGPVHTRELRVLPVLWPASLADWGSYRDSGTAWPVEVKRLPPGERSLQQAPLAWRLQSPERVAAEARLGALAGARLVELVDPLFGLPAAHALACCETLSRLRARSDLYTLRLAPAAVTAELVAAMEAAGFAAVAIDAISASPQVLDRLQAPHSADQLHAARALLARSPLQTLWRFRIGTPGETPLALLETLEFLRSLSPRDVVLLTPECPAGAAPERGLRVAERLLASTPVAAVLAATGGARGAAGAVQRVLALPSERGCDASAVAAHLVRRLLSA